MLILNKASADVLIAKDVYCITRCPSSYINTINCCNVSRRPLLNPHSFYWSFRSRSHQGLQRLRNISNCKVFILRAKQNYFTHIFTFLRCKTISKVSKYFKNIIKIGIKTDVFFFLIESLDLILTYGSSECPTHSTFLNKLSFGNAQSFFSAAVWIDCVRASVLWYSKSRVKLQSWLP